MAYQPRHKAHCLLIEDSDFDRRRLAHVLAHGAEVDLTIVRTLAEARVALGHNHFDLILLDNVLPDGLGVEFSKEIRQTEKWGLIPIILFSDYPTPFMYDKAIAAKVNIVLDKSKFQPKHVADALRFARVMATSRR